MAVSGESYQHAGSHRDAGLLSVVHRRFAGEPRGDLCPHYQDVHPRLCHVNSRRYRLLALIIIMAEFKFTKIVEHFKFLQFMPGLALFYLL